MEKGAGGCGDVGAKDFLSKHVSLSHTGPKKHLDEPKSPIDCVLHPSSSCRD